MAPLRGTLATIFGGVRGVRGLVVMQFENVHRTAFCSSPSSMVNFSDAVPNDGHVGVGSDQRKAIQFVLGQFAVFHFDDVLGAHFLEGTFMTRNRHRWLVDAQHLQDTNAVASGNVFGPFESPSLFACCVLATSAHLRYLQGPQHPADGKQRHAGNNAVEGLLK